MRVSKRRFIELPTLGEPSHCTTLKSPSAHTLDLVRSVETVTICIEAYLQRTSWVVAGTTALTWSPHLHQPGSAAHYNVFEGAWTHGSHVVWQVHAVWGIVQHLPTCGVQDVLDSVGHMGTGIMQWGITPLMSVPGWSLLVTVLH
jgi:hypothetical protein